MDLKSASNHIFWACNHFQSISNIFFSCNLPGFVVISINELLIAFWSSGLSKKTFSDSPISAFWMLLISILNFSFMYGTLTTDLLTKTCQYLLLQIQFLPHRKRDVWIDISFHGSFWSHHRDYTRHFLLHVKSTMHVQTGFTVCLLWWN